MAVNEKERRQSREDSRVQVEDRGAVLKALNWFGSGLDFADALHLASSHEASRFATFDRTLAKAAREIEGAPKVDLLGGTSSTA